MKKLIFFLFLLPLFASAQPASYQVSAVHTPVYDTTQYYTMRFTNDSLNNIIVAGSPVSIASTYDSITIDTFYKVVETVRTDYYATVMAYYQGVSNGYKIDPVSTLYYDKHWVFIGTHP